MLRRCGAFVVACAINLPGLAGAQSSRARPPVEIAAAYAAGDAFADAASRRDEQSVPALAAYLARAGPDELTRTRALYRWVTAHIAYDVAGLRTANYGDVSAEGVLKRRMSVCEGYARLTAALGSAMGLEVEVVRGWSKGYGFGSIKQFDGAPNHTWNAVRIDGRWRLMDATWGAGYLDPRMQFVRRFQDYYFLTAPEAFVFDHLPEEARWQLVERPVSRAQYADMVYLQPMFFLSGFRIVSNPRERIAAENHLTVTLGVTQSVQMIAQLVDPVTNRAVPGEFAFTQVDDAKAEIRAVFPRAGDYVLRVFAKPRGAAGELDWVLDYRVHASKGAREDAFPVAYSGMGTRAAWLLEPLGGQLKTGKSYRFRLRAPGALEVVVIAGKVWTTLVRDGDEFTGTVVAGAGDNIVFAKYDAASSLLGLLKYVGY